jgi:hypothetical protein
MYGINVSPHNQPEGEHMRARVLVTIAALCAAASLHAQIRFQEGFEASDSVNLPPGWSKWNQAGFPIDPESHWMVQDTGREIPGIVTTRLTVARSGVKAARTSWVAGVDTVTGSFLTADVWLITRRISGIQAGDSLEFWAIGGNGGTTGTYYIDTLEVWLGDTDSLPTSQTLMLDLITWRNGTSTYGVFKKYAYDVSLAAGLDIFVSFRYHTNVSVDGYAVFLDDVRVEGPLTDVDPIRGGTPDDFALLQNFPNPFNPSTTIQWHVPTTDKVTLGIYDMLGRQVGTLVNAEMEPGQYSTTWDATGFPSGTYFYRLQIGNSTATRKLVLLR